MRAVARGLYLQTLPACPEQCGGPRVDTAGMSEQMRRHRIRHGCDADIPEDVRSHYAIRCPACDGAAAYGRACGTCSDETPGFLHMRRCPASHASPDIVAALESLTWLNAHHLLPAEGGLSEQSINFVEFRTLFDRERLEVEREQEKEG